MHSVRAFITGIGIILGFLWIATLLLPSKVTVSKSILISASEAEVAKEIESFKYWKDWYPAFRDSTMAVAIQKSDSSFVTLSDNKHRKLSMSLTKRPEEIDILLSGESKTNVSYQFILMAGRTGHTRLSWNVNTILPWYPWKKITGIFLDKINGPQYQEALENLKIAAEKKHQESLFK